MKYLKRAIFAVVFLGILGWVIYFVPPPKAWYSATTYQILIFLIPLLLLLTTLINIFIGFLEKSFSLALGLLVLIVLYSIEELNIVTAFLTILASFLLSTTFKKPLWKPRKVEKLDKGNSVFKIHKVRLPAPRSRGKMTRN